MSVPKSDVQGAGRRLLHRGAQGVSRVRRSVSRRPRVLLYLGILGPGVIAASAGNDAGGIATFASVGADHGYKLLWILIPLTFSLGIVQEMCARMGAVTGKGLSDLIRERFGVRWTAFVMIALLIANGGVTVSEFVGIAAATELLGVARYVSVPIAAVAIWWLVVKGSYKRVERVFLVMSLVFVAYVVSAFLAHPPWGTVAREIIHPHLELTSSYLFTLVAVIGTTISPYMQVFIQSSVVEKGVRAENYRLTRADVWIGTVFAILIVFFIVVSTAATLNVRGEHVETAAREAPIFLGIFTFLVALGALIAMMPGLPLIRVLLVTQVINGVLLPVVLIAILRLVNNRELMGPHVNGPLYNIVAWLTTIVVSGLSLLLILTTVFPHLFSR